MTKKERRAMQLQRHYTALELLAADCGCKKINGKRISCALLRIEQEANRYFTWCCNGYTTDSDNYAEQVRTRFEPSEDEHESKLESFRAAVAKVLGSLPAGFVLNGDPRGYSLKLEAAGAGTVAAKDYGLQRDMGGHQLLAPMITGD